MGRGVDNDRKKVKAELKREVTSYSSNYNTQSSKKTRTSIKNAITNSPIELAENQHKLYKTIKNSTFTVVQGPAGTSSSSGSRNRGSQRVWVRGNRRR